MRYIVKIYNLQTMSSPSDCCDHSVEHVKQLARERRKVKRLRDSKTSKNGGEGGEVKEEMEMGTGGICVGRGHILGR
jgi:hypothetical protein